MEIISTSDVLSATCGSCGREQSHGGTLLLCLHLVCDECRSKGAMRSSNLTHHDQDLDASEYRDLDPDLDPDLAGSKHNLVCPLCKSTTPTSLALHPHPLLPRIADQQLLRRGGSLPCGVCINAFNAERICLECGDALCSECLSHHSRARRTQHHTVLPPSADSILHLPPLTPFACMGPLCCSSATPSLSTTKSASATKSASVDLSSDSAGDLSARAPTHACAVCDRLLCPNCAPLCHAAPLPLPHAAANLVRALSLGPSELNSSAQSSTQSSAQSSTQSSTQSASTQSASASASSLDPINSSAIDAAIHLLHAHHKRLLIHTAVSLATHAQNLQARHTALMQQRQIYSRQVHARNLSRAALRPFLQATQLCNHAPILAAAPLIRAAVPTLQSPIPVAQLPAEADPRLAIPLSVGVNPAAELRIDADGEARKKLPIDSDFLHRFQLLSQSNSSTSILRLLNDGHFEKTYQAIVEALPELLVPDSAYYPSLPHDITPLQDIDLLSVPWDSLLPPQDQDADQDFDADNHPSVRKQKQQLYDAPHQQQHQKPKSAPAHSGPVVPAIPDKSASRASQHQALYADPLFQPPKQSDSIFELFPSKGPSNPQPATTNQIPSTTHQPSREQPSAFGPKSVKSTQPAHVTNVNLAHASNVTERKHATPTSAPQPIPEPSKSEIASFSPMGSLEPKRQSGSLMGSLGSMNLNFFAKEKPDAHGTSLDIFSGFSKDKTSEKSAQKKKALFEDDEDELLPPPKPVVVAKPKATGDPFGEDDDDGLMPTLSKSSGAQSERGLSQMSAMGPGAARRKPTRTSLFGEDDD
eukprot:TRINITY_DN4318_c0_g1_i2.p1 TRINITY_DN4318_c0_g1~~TRINITY_DN4318_c0_g1_i2.p1  ORF type:complete len:815 (+),score=169.78 TRINITY_DN4318_c0_g1_i2:69-2513(+)